MQKPENNLIHLQTKKEITRLYKHFLELIEDIRCDHQTMVTKISEKYGPEAAKQIDYFTQPKYEHIRKRVLDSGNECARQMLSFIEYYDFVINKDKLDAAVNQKRMVTKKFVTSSPTIVEYKE